MSKFLTISCSVLCCLFISINLVAQEEQVEFQRTIGLSISDGSSDNIQVFSVAPGGGEFMTFENPGMFLGDEMSMVINPEFAKELSLIPEQLEKLKTGNREFQKRITDFFNANGEGGIRMNDPKQIKEFMSSIENEKRALLEEVLLPHQVNRLHQVKLQNEFRSRGDIAAITSAKMLEALGIDNEQKDRLAKRAEEIRKQLDKDIAELKAKARKDLLSELTSDQRSKLETMMGENYEIKGPSIRQRIERARETRESSK
ncbi:MAG TPA: hypothetical protein PKD64_18155 [Pirellulaceae bacterium]|nr:hypothetical protein [Pirellulaceae bacterium]HMO94112.1 hypothetical protein [Pirellulaceae bacterium]HMP71039.1 hypothetical protein [Pirellulaceae bacterium]